MIDDETKDSAKNAGGCAHGGDALGRGGERGERELYRGMGRHARAGSRSRCCAGGIGDWFGTDGLPLETLVALGQSPLLLAGRRQVADLLDEPVTDGTEPAPEPDVPPPLPPLTVETGDLAFLDNGVPAQTASAASGNYAMVGSVPIKNASRQTLDTAALADGSFSAALSEQAPQVLIVHTHGSEAYTMPAGEEYAATGSFRTDDATRSVVRVGDEIAAVLSSYGISVLHDRTLHDSPSYNGAYARSLTSIEGYLEKYPSLSFVLDVHRDAVQDASGQQYKLVSREEPHAAQISLVMGSDHDRWQDNLRLAVAVEERLMQSYPTLMRPITLRNYSYNQSVCPGSMLVEVGAAGNSLDEAIYAARLFAAGLAETITA